MKQVVQSISGGPIRVVDAPRPVIEPTEVLVRTTVSTISAGTERAVTQLAQSSLLAKARARPDLVRQVVKKAKAEGVSQAIGAVRSRLAEDLPLGYSAAGLVVEVGSAVPGVPVGALVATGGAGKANHAEYQAVPGLLCVPVPANVDPGDASMATIASIALHGLRLADVGPGGKIVVVGLGLVGQMAGRLALASGCDVAGIDVSDFAIDKARSSGITAFKEHGADTTASILEWSRGRGADAVIVTASGKSSDAMGRTPELCRDRARIVVVGDVGLDLSRTPFYEKELTIRFARSYGPGRYERSYEDWGVDYPAGYVRWTEGRNIEAVLDLLASGRLTLSDLVTHHFAIERAEEAYELIQSRSEPYLAVQLSFTERVEPVAPTPRPAARSGGLSVGLVGAGSFARSILVPAMKDAGFERFAAVASASGTSAQKLADSGMFERAVEGADQVIDAPDVDVVVIATRHDSHASLAARALRAGKHVFCEKPLGLTEDELDDLAAALHEGGGVLFAGFNRRWSRPVEMVVDHFSGTAGPLVITYRVNAGSLPETHWYRDRRQGGRLIGEVCHFIDTCEVLVGSPASTVSAAAAGRREDLQKDDLVVALGFDGGAVATIAYASGGHPGTEKERVEVLGRGRSASIVDYREVVLDGKKTQIRPQDKGHVREMKEFLRTLRGEREPVDFLSSSRTTLRAASALGSS
jgi:predicted dehydrogenase/threonine dehydrogenase-like Zn-dependent dehydrogenase